MRSARGTPGGAATERERDGELRGHGRHGGARGRETIENVADLAFQAATTGAPSTVTTAPATTAVLVPDLAIGKTHAPALSPGQPSTYTITVGNVGEGPTSGLVTVTDTIEAPGLTLNGTATGTGGRARRAGATITCTRSDALAAGSDYPPISIPVLVSPGARPGSSATPRRCRRRATATLTTTPSPTAAP